ncbi:tRNA (uridine(54)-C5)-methyltransferase TrmA [Ventosimonas gracilis]|uniref:tRNA/tmRNA (uracil-C(5))-methyltransferase n=1 Tax=Ventosimonas gracilis TaxID=1680762 RepID=A0A139SYG7_9GAMM|nr:tRNA (uridine(54)-C5)-methyltransferase TrmA [Ventosimonas gracilis]KXU39440.1 tRNA (uridine(54)-C5)-methyltransferase TrmA [Ventosimonas gracilis]
MSAPNYLPEQYDVQLAAKCERLKALLAPFAAPTLEVFDSPRSHYRQRAEFRLWRENGERHYAMFAPGDKHSPIFLDAFPIASRRINQLMPQLAAALRASEALAGRLFQVEFLTTLAGDALITLCYHRPLDEIWQSAAQALAAQLEVSLIGRSRGQRLVIGRDYVCEALQVGSRRYRYRQPEGSFSQPNADVCQKMLAWAVDALGQQEDDLLELYCGNGNFTVPLAGGVRRVLATEISKSATNAARANLLENAIDNVQLVRLSAEEVGQALSGVRVFRRLAQVNLSDYQFGTLLVDPPRAGLDSATCALAQDFKRILYISCNPETLVDNLRRLNETHQIRRSALFDQFPYTHHLECGVLLEKR